MKSSVVSVLFAAAASAIVPVVALIPLNATVLSATFAGVVGLLVTGFAWADYTRKPRFRLHDSRHPAAAVETSEQRAAADWTYQTVSA